MMMSNSLVSTLLYHLSTRLAVPVVLHLLLFTAVASIACLLSAALGPQLQVQLSAVTERHLSERIDHCLDTIPHGSW